MTLTRIVPPLLVIAAAVVAAQEPVFRGDTRLVRLDVSVLDAGKQPVRDLTAADFRVSERGEVLPMRAFQRVEVPTTDGSAAGARLSGDAPALRNSAVESEADAGPRDLTSVNPGRLIVLVMDDGMTPNEPRWTRQARNIARSVVEGMGSYDRIAIQSTRTSRTRLEFTMSRSALLADVEAFDPGGFLALPPTDSWRDEEPRYWRTITALENTVDALARLTDRQKLIVYIGPGIPKDNDGDLFRARVALFQAAERANVVVYTFDPTGLDTLEDYIYERTRLGARMAPTLGQRGPMSDMARTAQAKALTVARETIEFSTSLAESTGGRALIRTDIFEPAVAQMFADTSVYYLIAVDPPSSTPDGKFHEVTVKVDRPHVDVRARPGYYYNK